ncbi:hypothetical protein DSC91_000728 [Paraburkholderia caffeinilytica]|uniref:Proline rich protein n=2 Tax=Paraburkholderia caffeinilytica TaxID=1761016 RepID=A0ABQ1N7V5_9BURK|nr:hypothetical protein DSC91_000728 [Paraburkholderia caffeinilytica]GGC56504.1 hypothetical protein GCM10011400_50200 [Paraburkholderia caffeinilytica]CAB3809626.1 hypothetical protein LMG28690_07339 [Paraburkholderia caffeinilytica]
MNLALVKRLRAHLPDGAAVKPALVKRVLLTCFGIAVIGLGYRAQVVATQTPVVLASIHEQGHDDMRAGPASVHHQSSASAVPVTSRETAAAPVSARRANAASAASASSVANASSASSASSATNANPAITATPRAKLIALRAPLSVDSANNPFAASSWLPPPPPVEVPVVPEVRAPAPTAPPVPFTYLGELDAKAAKPQVFLSNGDRLLIVSPGEVVDNQYRVESVSESDVVLTYLPLNQTQAISIPREAK